MKRKLLLASIVLMAIIAPTSVFANNGVPSSVTELEASFSGFETFLSDLSSEVNDNIANILSLNSTQTQLISDLSQAETDIVSLNSLISQQTTLINSLNQTVIDLSVTVSGYNARIISEETESTDVFGFSSAGRHGLAENPNVTAYVSTNKVCLESSLDICSAITSQLVTSSGTLKDMIISLDVIPVNGYTFTIYKNDSATSITCTISASTVKTCSDNTNTVSVVAGDTIMLVNDMTNSVQSIILVKLLAGVSVQP